MSDELMGIGAFSFRSGLTIPALRHYDEVGLLPPAIIDPQTGYRRYRPDQVRTARLICGLRAVDLPVEEIRQILDLGDPVIEGVLEEHRRRLANRQRTLSRMTATLDEYLTKGSPMPERTGRRPVQITIHADDVPEAVAFYSNVFDAEFDESISSFQFGAWNTDSFFLLTIEPQAPEHPGYPGRGACSGSSSTTSMPSISVRWMRAASRFIRPGSSNGSRALPWSMTPAATGSPSLSDSAARIEPASWRLGISEGGLQVPSLCY